jgi:DNA-binding transcriptional MerR regulator
MKPSETFENLGGLARAVNGWCEGRGFSPASGQAAENLSERSLRYYRSLGLLDAPLAGGGYGRRHFLQLAAIRVLQSRGMPLRRIQELLYGRGDENLAELLERAGKAETAPRFAPFSSESWTVHPLGGAFALISRDGSRVSESQLQAISKILNPKPTKTQTPR